MNWNPVFIRPRHTLKSVIVTLRDGLKDGTIVLGPTLKLFPEFDTALEKEFKGEPVYAATLAEFLPRIVERLAMRQTPYLRLVTSLEGFWKLLQELRRGETSPKEDLAWYIQDVIAALEKATITTPQTLSEFARQAKVLEVGLDQHETAVLGEVNIELQLVIAQLLKSALQSIGNTLHSELESTWKRESGKSLPFPVISAMENAFSSATRSRYSDLDARIELLRLALAREQAALAAQSLIDASITDKRVPRRQA